MLTYPVLRERARELRKLGLSYTEIHEKVPVSKSTLSLWLSDIALTQEQRQRLLAKMVAAQPLASQTLKRNRILRTEIIIKEAKKEIGKISERDLWLLGVFLYWAEGHKQKEHNPSRGVMFNNSDPSMIKFYLKWLNVCLKIPSENIWFEIYIHKTYQKAEKDLKDYWSKITNFPVSKFDRIYLKKNKVHSFRKNRGDNYWGVLRIGVKKSTDLNRKITGWVEGICSNLKKI
jgi:transcriptional regulator with XRE-family HTH domain